MNNGILTFLVSIYRGTFYYLCSILDGYRRFIVHWKIRERMTEADVEIVLQRAKEKYPDERPWVISDNGHRFITRDFKEFIRISGKSHVRTSPYYPQSLKKECIRLLCPLSLEEARRIVENFVSRYNTRRLHSAIWYIIPKDKLEGRDKAIFAERNRRLQDARERRKARRRGQRQIFKEHFDLINTYA